MKRPAMICMMIIGVFLNTGISAAQNPGQVPGGAVTGPGAAGGCCPCYGASFGPHPGFGTGPGMMRGYGGWDSRQGRYMPSEACQKFLGETADQRKQFNAKHYEYMEAMRNPKSSNEDLVKLEQEMRDLQAKIQTKDSQGCWW